MKHTKEAMEYYISETGNKRPDSLSLYSEWYQGYVEWLEIKALEFRRALDYFEFYGDQE